MTIIKCHWCGKEFEWDSTMYPFCDDCIRKLGKIEEIIYRLTHTHFNLVAELERVLPDWAFDVSSGEKR